MGRWAALLRKADWTVIRKVARLSIVNRLSYGLLVVVPVLAWFWPVVATLAHVDDRLMNEGRRLVAEVESYVQELQDLEREETPDDSRKGRVDPGWGRRERIVESAVSMARRLRVWMDEARTGLQPFDGKPPKLPWTLVSGFFGALFVAVAHAGFQLGAPPEIRSWSSDAFAQQKKQAYKSLGTEEDLRRARAILESDAGTAVRDRLEKDGRAAIERLKPLDDAKRLLAANGLSESMRQGAMWLLDHEQALVPADGDLLRKAINDRGRHSRDEQEVWAMDLVGLAAVSEYQKLAEGGTAIRCMCLLLYGLALSVAVAVSCTHVATVISSSGWQSPLDLWVEP